MVDTTSKLQENSPPFHGWHSNHEDEEEKGNNENELDGQYIDLQRKLEEDIIQAKKDDEYAKSLEDELKSPRPSTSLATNLGNTFSKRKNHQQKLSFTVSSHSSGTTSSSSDRNSVSDIEDTQEMLEEFKKCSNTHATQESLAAINPLAELEDCCDIVINEEYIKSQKQEEQRILQAKADEEFARKLQEKINEEEKLQRSEVLTRNRTPLKSSKTLGVKRQMSIEEIMSPDSGKDPKRIKMVRK